jgi:hypothetical protein
MLLLGVVAILETRPDEQKERRTRATKCACGEHLKAEDGEVLFERALKHVDQEQPREADRRQATPRPL